MLVIDDRIPVPEIGCGYPRSLRIVEGLADVGFQVTLFPLQFPEKVEPYTSRLQRKGIEVLFAANHETLNFQSFFAERKDNFDAVFVSRPHNMREVLGIIRKLKPHQKIIYDAEALFSYREILRKQLQGSMLEEAKKNEMIQEEIRLMSGANLVLTVSEREKSILETWQIKNVKVLSHQIDTDETTNSFDDRKDILFVGGFTPATPNEDAMMYFVHEVFPQVQKKLGAKLWIVGTNYLDSVKNLKGEHIIVTGRVENLWDYYNRCKVFVTPTRYAAGISLKLLESLAHGLPAVVTPLIAEQLGLHEEVVLIGDDAQNFAKKIIQCYTQKQTWNRLRSNGLNYIESTYNREGFAQTLKELRNALR